MASPFTPSSSHGSSLPSQWTTGTGGQLEITADDDSAVTLFISAAPGQTKDVADFTGTAGGSSGFSVLKDGTLNLNIGAAAVNNGVSVGFAAAFALDILSIFQNFAPFATVFRIDQDGYLGIQSHAAPADGSIASGEAMLWFDQTDGAGNTKLMVKGKSANGTVKTATILLA